MAKGNKESGSSQVNRTGKGDLQRTIIGKSPDNPIGRLYGEPIGPVKPKNIPRTYVPTPVKPKAKLPVAVKKPPVKKPAAQVISNVTRERMSPTKALFSNRPPATRFGTVTGKVTGTRVSGGAGYGGGGTRGSGSLSGGGSGTRSAGTSRTGGTQRNDPVRG